MSQQVQGFVVLSIVAALCFGFGCSQSLNDKGIPLDVESNAIPIASVGGSKTPIPASNLDLIERAVKRLLDLQEEDGAWPYEGVYRVRGKIPVGYRAGGTSIACEALLSAPIKDRGSIRDAVTRGIELVLSELDQTVMKVSTRDAYDVRVWGHIYALDLFCQLETEEAFKDIRKRTVPWIKKLIDIVIEEELTDGGWNYASRRRHACFVTAPAAQALMRARSLGYEIPNDVFERSAKALLASRTETGAFQYSGFASQRQSNDQLPGSIARGAVSESTLLLLGQGSVDNVRASIDAFHKHWQELEKRRQKQGTHQPPFGVAPYYFYYGHRYLAQAIQLLPIDEQEKAYQQFEAVLLKTKEEDDDTWNDRVFKRSKAFGTSMSLLALSRNHAHPPAAILND